MKKVCVNPYEICVDHFLKRVSKAKGMTWHFASSFQKYSADSKMNMGRIDEDEIRIAATIYFKDLSCFDNYLDFSIKQAHDYIVKKKDFDTYVEQILYREYARTLSICYEYFESYLKDLVANYLYLNPSDCVRIENYPRLKANHEFDFSNYGGFRGLTSKVTPLALLKFIRKINTNLGRLETNNSLHINYHTWFKVFTEVRHAIIHKDLFLEKNRVTNYEIMLHNYFGVLDEGVNYFLQIKKEDLDQNIAFLISYAYTLFKNLSVKGEFDFNIFPVLNKPNT